MPSHFPHQILLYTNFNIMCKDKPNQECDRTLYHFIHTLASPVLFTYMAISTNHICVCVFGVISGQSNMCALCLFSEYNILSTDRIQIHITKHKTYTFFETGTPRDDEFSYYVLFKHTTLIGIYIGNPKCLSVFVCVHNFVRLNIKEHTYFYWTYCTTAGGSISYSI